MADRIHENIDLVDDKIDKSLNAFTERIKRSERGAFNRTLAMSKELELNADGSIKQTIKNLRLMAKIRVELKNAIFNPSYQTAVKRYLETFPDVEKLNGRYFKAIAESYNPNRQLYREVLKNSMRATRESLAGAGIETNVISPVIDILTNSVQNGATYADMVKELEVSILGDPDRLGNLMRYTGQISTDAINQFNADYNQTIANDLDLDWYLYSGARRKTSRPFCKKYSNKYFHKKEVEDFGRKKDLDGSNLCSNNFCAGMVKGTTSSSIFRYRGGYNCRHIFKPTTVNGVPKNVVKRNIEKGYYEE